MYRLLIAIANTVMWFWFINWSLELTILWVIQTPLLLVVILWPLILVAAVAYFLAWCYALSSRMDQRAKPWLEKALVAPWLLVVLPLAIHVAAFAYMMKAWYRVGTPPNP